MEKKISIAMWSRYHRELRAMSREGLITEEDMDKMFNEFLNMEYKEAHKELNNKIHRKEEKKEMKLKIDSRIKLTKEQLIEVENLIMFDPNMVWNYNENTRKKYLRHYLVQLDGEYAIYKYTVNVAMGIIRLVEVYVKDYSEDNERKEERK